MSAVASPTAPAATPVGAPALPKTLTELDFRLRTLLRQNKGGEAEALCRQLLAQAARDARLRRRLAEVLYRLGKAEDARKEALAALRDDTGGDKDLRILLARIANDRTQPAEAEKFLEQAAPLTGTSADYWLELGRLRRQQNRTGEAIAAFEAALNLKASLANVMYWLAMVLEARADSAAGDIERAEFLLRSAIQRQPGFTMARIALGNLYANTGREEEAIPLYREAINQTPKDAGARGNLGAVLRRLHRYEEAEAVYREALEIQPNADSVLYNYGNLLKSQGRIDEATAMFDRALAVQPENGTYHWNKALGLLSAHDLKRGFEEYEWRWKFPGFPTKARQFRQPMWQRGQDITGKRLLVYAEQGMGDVLQFARFLPVIRDRLGPDGKLIFAVHEQLFCLFRDMPGLDAVIERLAEPAEYDLQLPLISAPFVLETTAETLPAGVPYIPTHPADRFPLDLAADRLNIGFIWAGNPAFSGDKARSTVFDTLRPLLALPYLRGYSLQKGYAEEQIDRSTGIEALGERITDFAQTAAAMGQLDGVVTTCTSTAHLAGALGVPTFVMLGWDPDWRWLHHRNDSPWYPSAQVFRQASPGDWAGVVQQVGAALHAAAQSKGVA